MDNAVVSKYAWAFSTHTRLISCPFLLFIINNLKTRACFLIPLPYDTVSVFQAGIVVEVLCKNNKKVQFHDAMEDSAQNHHSQVLLDGGC